MPESHAAADALPIPVIPAHAGIQKNLQLDSGLRRNDGQGLRPKKKKGTEISKGTPGWILAKYVGYASVRSGYSRLFLSQPDTQALCDVEQNDAPTGGSR